VDVPGVAVAVIPRGEEAAVEWPALHDGAVVDDGDPDEVVVLDEVVGDVDVLRGLDPDPAVVRAGGAAPGDVPFREDTGKIP
jgi:hypothetical protein